MQPQDTKDQLQKKQQKQQTNQRQQSLQAKQQYQYQQNEQRQRQQQQQQRQPGNPQHPGQQGSSLPLQQIFQISETPQTLRLRTRLSDSCQKLINEAPSRAKFSSFTGRGKYRELQFSFSNEQRTVTAHMNKHYYLNVLNLKKYEILVFSRNYLNSFDDYMGLMCQILNSSIIKNRQCTMVKMDVISMTIMRDYYTIGFKNNMQIKRLFLKISPFQFRHSPFLRTKQCEQFFSAVIKHVHPNQMVEQKPQVPSDQQFYHVSRTSFIDDMYSNQSFTTRFVPRFYTFYQAHSLFLGTTPMQHKMIRQFYMKVTNRCVMNAMRLKKISFHFKIPTFDKCLKVAIYLYCVDENKLIPVTAPTVTVPNQDTKLGQSSFPNHAFLNSNNPFNHNRQFKQNIQFNLQVVAENEQAEKYANLHDNFVRHLYDSVNGQVLMQVQAPDTKVIDHTFIQFFGTSAPGRNYRFMNQAGFCRMLCQFSFYMDRVIFKSTPNKTVSEAQSVNLKDPSLNFKLPPTDEHKFKKYAISYIIQVKSTYNYQMQLTTSMSTISAQQQKMRLPYEHVLNKIYLSRKKMSKENTKDSIPESLEFASNLEQIKGLVVYCNQVLKKWNASDCYPDLNNFVAGYLNVVVDKNKEKSEKSYFKSVPHLQWKVIIDALSALTQSLTKSFSGPQNTLILNILSTYQEGRNEQLNRQQIVQGQQVMVMTIKILKLTCAGWLQILPSGLFFFQMQRQCTYLYTDTYNPNNPNEKREEIHAKSRREQIQKIVRSYISKNYKGRLDLPPIFYDRSQRTA